MLEYIKNWTKANGPIPEGMEIHHKIPPRLGGSDSLDNLELVDRPTHAQRHKELYEQYGDTRDLCASYMLSGKYGPDKRRIAAVIGGQIGGKKTKALNLGIHTKDKEKHRKWAQEGGTASQKTLKERQVSAFYDPALRENICSKGGKNGPATLDYWIKQGYSIEESKIKYKENQAKAGKKAGIMNKGKRHVNNSSIGRTVHSEILEQFLIDNPDYKLGRKK